MEKNQARKTEHAAWRGDLTFIWVIRERVTECQGIDAEMCPACLRNIKGARVAETEKGRGEGGGRSQKDQSGRCATEM